MSNPNLKRPTEKQQAIMDKAKALLGLQHDGVEPIHLYVGRCIAELQKEQAKTSAKYRDERRRRKYEWNGYVPSFACYDDDNGNSWFGDEW